MKPFAPVRLQDCNDYMPVIVSHSRIASANNKPACWCLDPLPVCLTISRATKCKPTAGGVQEKRRKEKETLEQRGCQKKDRKCVVKCPQDKALSLI